jgi:hypothetical protein
LLKRATQNRPKDTATAGVKKMRKRKLKRREIRNISFAVSYSLTTAFIEENHRPPNEEEKQKIVIKGMKYIYDILDNFE